MLTLKYNQPNWPKKVENLPTEDEKPLQSLDDEENKNRNYNDDSFYLPLSENDNSNIRSNNKNQETDKDSSNSYWKDNKCCIALEKIKINVDKHCLSENKKSENSTNIKQFTSSIPQSKPNNDTYSSSTVTRTDNLQFKNEINFQLKESKTKGNGFKKSKKSFR